MEWLNVKKCTEEEGRKRQKYKKLLASDERSSMTLSAAQLLHGSSMPSSTIFQFFSFIRREFCIHCLPPSLDNTFQFAQLLHVTQPVWVSYRLFFHKPTIFSYEHCPCVSKFSESRIIIYTNNKVTYIQGQEAFGLGSLIFGIRKKHCLRHKGLESSVLLRIQMPKQI